MINSGALAVIIRSRSFYKLNILAEFCTDGWISEVIACMRNVVSLVRAIATLGINHTSPTRPVGVSWCFHTSCLSQRRAVAGDYCNLGS